MAKYYLFSIFSKTEISSIYTIKTSVISIIQMIDTINQISGIFSKVQNNLSQSFITSSITLLNSASASKLSCSATNECELYLAWNYYKYYVYN